MTSLRLFDLEPTGRAARLAISLVFVMIATRGGPASAQTFNSGSTGADGALNPTTNTTLTLPPNGVFNFTTINIPAGVTVTFTRNAANTPVTLLASGNVTIAGTISANASPGGAGANGTIFGHNGGAGGSGGFDGGAGGNGLISPVGGSGLGPGGGGGATITDATFSGTPGLGGGGGGFAGTGADGGARGGSATALGGTPYGTPTLLPLIGGSGGGGGGAPSGVTGAGGGGGGGALLIATSGTITLTGNLFARGGRGGDSSPNSSPGAGGGGSGGAIRLAATTITGNGGGVSVSGGARGNGTNGFSYGGGGSGGRIRIEAFTNTSTISSPDTSPSTGPPEVLTLPSAPSLRIASVAGVPAPASPTGSFATPDIAVPVGTPNPMTVSLAASNVPLGTTVSVKVTPLTGGASSAVSIPLGGTLAASTATASLTIPTNQPSVLSASATFTLAALPGAGPVFAQGEEVERVRVAAVLGGPSQVVYITTSGRELPAESLERR